jgi:phosphatidylserine/phosphatidylglycerophosphate/cardiolipin synthase-like enzyme
MAPAHIDRLDDAVGTGLERLVRAHHRRRLRRHGWARAYDPPADGSLWCVGDPPPRAGNAVEALVDGELALGRLAADIAAATESVHLAGWHFDPGFELVRDGPPLRALLAETAERVDVRLLAWAARRCRSSPPPARRCASSARSSCEARGSGWRSTRSSGRCTAITRSSP